LIGLNDLYPYNVLTVHQNAENEYKTLRNKDRLVDNITIWFGDVVTFARLFD